jgi:hypothetical protein
VDETSEPADDTAVQDTTVVEDAPAERAPKAGVSRAVLLVSIVAALLIGGAAGVAIGWKVEQERVKEDVENIRPIGTVTALDDDSVTIELETASGTKTYEITDRTTVDGTGELAEGSTILIRSWRGGEDGQLQANKIVVLDQGSEEDASG